jgi:hypothetical protein
VSAAAEVLSTMEESVHMKHTRSFAAVALLAVSALAAALLATGPANGAKPVEPRVRPADRVLIVLFDQMLPQYADQFAMPNYRRVRDHGRNFQQAYLG